jgi:hypothetical protein
VFKVCGSQPSSDAGRISTTRTSADTDALDMMVVAFEGGYSRAEIKERMDKAMTLYGLSLSEDEYNRAGSVLVALRNKSGISEMKILNYMIRSHVSGVNLTFPDAAALSVSFLEAGDR